MRYIEPHAHMVSRTTDDYQSMVVAGCKAVCEPAFWAGFDRSSVNGFYDYFCQLTDYEPKRSAKFGLPHFSWLCINPKESEDLVLAREVIAMIPDFLDRENVLGIGEIAASSQVSPAQIIGLLGAGIWGGWFLSVMRDQINLFGQASSDPDGAGPNSAPTEDQSGS